MVPSALREELHGQGRSDNVGMGASSGTENVLGPGRDGGMRHLPLGRASDACQETPRCPEGVAGTSVGGEWESTFFRGPVEHGGRGGREDGSTSYP